MTKYFVILLTIFSNSLLAQNIGYIKVDINGDCENPNMVISDYDAIIQPLSKDSSLNTIYEIRWQDYLTDGSFYFRILHNMIYLREGHNNPNPNDIYWAHVLSSENYNSINTYVKSNKSSIIELRHQIGFMNLQYVGLINESIIKDLDLLSAKRDSLLLDQANTILSDINTVLKEGNKFPTLLKSNLTNRQIVFRKDEIGYGRIKVIDE